MEKVFLIKAKGKKIVNENGSSNELIFFAFEKNNKFHTNYSNITHLLEHSKENDDIVTEQELKDLICYKYKESDENGHGYILATTKEYFEKRYTDKSRLILFPQPNEKLFDGAKYTYPHQSSDKMQELTIVYHSPNNPKPNSDSASGCCLYFALKENGKIKKVDGFDCTDNFVELDFEFLKHYKVYRHIYAAETGFNHYFFLAGKDYHKLVTRIIENPQPIDFDMKFPWEDYIFHEGKTEDGVVFTKSDYIKEEKEENTMETVDFKAMLDQKERNVKTIVEKAIQETVSNIHKSLDKGETGDSIFMPTHFNSDSEEWSYFRYFKKHKKFFTIDSKGVVNLRYITVKADPFPSGKPRKNHPFFFMIIWAIIGFVPSYIMNHWDQIWQGFHQVIHNICY